MPASISVVARRRVVLLALAAGLSLAAAIAIVAIATHSFDSTDERLTATSLGFSLCSVLAAAGAPARRHRRLGALGALTTGLAGTDFVLLELVIWGPNTTWGWRALGTVAVLTLAAAHASLVLSARCVADSPVITNLTVISVITASVEAVLALLGILGLVDQIDSSGVRLLAVLAITTLLSTALPPILRRAAASGNPADQRPPIVNHARTVEDDLRDVAHRLEQLAPATGHLADDIRRQAVRLRALADQPPQL